MSEKNWCDTNRTDFLHGSKWTEKIVGKFEKFIHSEPEGCCHISELALSTGVVDLWKQDKKNPFSFLAWLLTTDNFQLDEDNLHGVGEHLSHKLSDLIHKVDISQALKASTYISCCLRNYFSWDEKDKLSAWWDKKTINQKILSYGINYINLQGANLENVDLSGLKLPANLRKANLQGADLSNVDLCGAYLEGALVSEKQLSDATMDHTTELPRRGQVWTRTTK